MSNSELPYLTVEEALRHPNFQRMLEEVARDPDAAEKEVAEKALDLPGAVRYARAMHYVRSLFGPDVADLSLLLMARSHPEWVAAIAAEVDDNVTTIRVEDGRTNPYEDPESNLFVAQRLLRVLCPVGSREV